MFSALIILATEMCFIFSSVFIVFFILGKRIEENGITFLKSFIISIFFVIIQPAIGVYLFEFKTDEINKIESEMEERSQESINHANDKEIMQNEETFRYEDSIIYREFSDK